MSVKTELKKAQAEPLAKISFPYLWHSLVHRDRVYIRIAPDTDMVIAEDFGAVGIGGQTKTGLSDSETWRYRLKPGESVILSNVVEPVTIK